MTVIIVNGIVSLGYHKTDLFRSEVARRVRPFEDRQKSWNTKLVGSMNENNTNQESR